MRATWWFARQGLAARRGRTALLALAVVLASALVTAVACGLESARGNAEASLRRQMGATDARLVNRFGAAFDAAEAERCGLVSRVVPAKSLMEEAMKAAGKIAEKSAITVMAVKEAVSRAQETTLREGLLFERRLFHALFATADQKEGMAAFLEKRQPQFRDR